MLACNKSRGLGFKILSLGFRVQGLGFGVGSWVKGRGFGQIVTSYSTKWVLGM